MIGVIELLTLKELGKFLAKKKRISYKARVFHHLHARG
jgi:hypothetical protein